MSWWYSQIDLDDQVGSRAQPSRPKAVHRFAQIPTVVTPGHDHVDLFPDVLADVAGPQRATITVERQPPDVANAIGIDLGSGVRTRPTSSCRPGDGVLLACVLVIDVDPQDFAQQRAEILAGLVLIVVGLPLSPRPTCKKPSGPKASVPPLWFQNGLGIRRSCSSLSGLAVAWSGPVAVNRDKIDVCEAVVVV